jgi:hypothetical protein
MTMIIKREAALDRDREEEEALRRDCSDKKRLQRRSNDEREESGSSVLGLVRRTTSGPGDTKRGRAIGRHLKDKREPGGTGLQYKDYQRGAIKGRESLDNQRLPRLQECDKNGRRSLEALLQYKE